MLTGSGSDFFGIDGRGNVYLNVEGLDGDAPRPATYDLIVRASVVN